VLTDVQKHQFDTLGFVVLRGFLAPDEMRLYTAAFDETLGAITDPERWANESENVGASRFFEQNPQVYHRLLDDDKILEVIQDLLGLDFVFTVSEGARRYADTHWHHDDVAPEGHLHVKMVFYLDAMDADPGCLCLLPGSHHADYRERMERYGPEILTASRDVPGTYAIASSPGDAIVFNVKTYHGAFTGGIRRRVIYMNFLSGPRTMLGEAHLEFLYRRDGGYYTPSLFENAPPKRMRMLRFLKERCYDKAS
jgi:hypothetical protein